MHAHKTKRPAKFGHSDAPITGGDVPAALLKQARRSGQLNLSGRGLKIVPAAVWRVNSEPVSNVAASSTFDTDDKWWDQTELIKLILASNELSQLSEDIALLPALNVLDVSALLCSIMFVVVVGVVVIIVVIVVVASCHRHFTFCLYIYL